MSDHSETWSQKLHQNVRRELKTHTRQFTKNLPLPEKLRMQGLSSSLAHLSLDTIPEKTEQKPPGPQPVHASAPQAPRSIAYALDQVPLNPGKALKPHQQHSMRYMHYRETHPHPSGVQGGILNLQMGLGKTLLMLASTVHAREVERRTEPTLYVCKKSLLENVTSEHGRFLTMNRLPFIVLHPDILGAKAFKSVLPVALQQFSLIVMTYDTVQQFHKEYLKQLKQQEQVQVQVQASASPANMDPSSAGYNPMAAMRALIQQQDTKSKILMSEWLFTTGWYRIIADESQTFANPKSQVFKAMAALKSVRGRWCTTGTPFRNTTQDIFAQLRFCGLKGCEKPSLCTAEVFETLKLKECILTMRLEDSGIVLPKLHTHRVVVPLSAQQQHFYKQGLGQSAQLFQLYEQGNELGKTHKADVRRKLWRSVLIHFLRLRQICVAPYLMCANLNVDTEKKHKKRKTSSAADHKATGSLKVNQLIDQADQDMRALFSQLQFTTQGDNQLAEAMEKKRLELSQIVTPNSPQEKWLMHRAGGSGLQSPKVQRVCQLVTHDIPPHEKVVIFAEWTGFVELACEALQSHPQVKQNGWLILQVTGSDNAKRRSDVFTTFRTNPRARVLICTRVGSVGLNFPEANHVIHAQPDWNIVVQRQGTARVHRMGQEKEVHEYLLTTDNTVESYMEQVCSQKMGEENEVIRQAMQKLVRSCYTTPGALAQVAPTPTPTPTPTPNPSQS